jgi:peptidoglycan hydrolase CwlO-like protein
LCCVANVADAQDWRAHLEQMQKHRSGIDEALAATKTQLDKLHSDIELTLEKISSREKFLNGQLEPYLIQYRSLQVSNIKFHYVLDTDALFAELERNSPYFLLYLIQYFPH